MSSYLNANLVLKKFLSVQATGQNPLGLGYTFTE